MNFQMPLFNQAIDLIFFYTKEGGFCQSTHSRKDFAAYHRDVLYFYQLQHFLFDKLTIYIKYTIKVRFLPSMH